MVPRSPTEPFYLLEVNIISAQDLAPVTRAMRTYAVAWVQPDCRLRTRVDKTGLTDPTWNDKFIFRVDDWFVRSETAAVMIEIYGERCFKDACIGTVRVLVGNLLPCKGVGFSGMKFTALQVRRPSGRPQGILNLGITVFNSSMTTMPLYTQPNSALGYRDLMGETFRPVPVEFRRSKSGEKSMTESVKGIPKPETGMGFTVLAGKGSLWSESGEDASASVGEFFPAEVGSSVLEGWSLASSAGKEDLGLKLERWRTEFPPDYDLGYGSSRRVASRKSGAGDGGGGLFSCFRGNGEKFTAGCECSIFCGLNSKARKKNAAAAAAKIPMTPSDVSKTFSFV